MVEEKMNKIEQAYKTYTTAQILPILKSYSGKTINAELAKEINNKIIDQLRADYVPIEYEVVVDEPDNV
jgi:hypothetical protein